MEITLTEEQSLISRDPDVLGGIPVFAGTRVPIKTMLDYLEKGHALAVFLDDFPTVSRHQAQQVLALLAQKLMEPVAG